MDRILIGFLTAVSLFTAGVSAANPTQDTPRAEHAPPPMTGQTVATEGAIKVDQVKINYQAQTGVLELSKEDPEDPVTGMFYVAYFKKNENKNESRPITFIYNGGPGSASLWLHMGALGPKRVIATQPEKTQLAPYQLTDNQYSLLNVSDLVFIDAPERVTAAFPAVPPASRRERSKKHRVPATSMASTVMLRLFLNLSFSF